MPVNTAALKTFAPAMRRQLLEAVGRKLDLLLNSQTPDTLSTYARQIAELREQEAENRDQLLERVAYTWFNRLCALRYLDARGWHPFGCKVLMPAGEGETQPELLKLMRAGSLPAELKPHTNESRLHGLLDGQIPPAVAGADPQGEVYRELVLASCRSYHQLLPELFEGLDDASELLLPDDLLSEGSIAGGFRNAISTADCADVEIIGWLYQFYIAEKKDDVIGKVVKSEDIPAATQLFTPNWIVKYMVQNSLGASWLATYPDSQIKGQMEFYIEPAEQTPHVQAQLAAITPESLDPEALTLIDPACGSGHILVEAYDLLKAIYLERGYQQRDIPELILTQNLYGLDICPRAAQLANFSLLMKGREDDRRLLERGIHLNVMALQDSKGLTADLIVASATQCDPENALTEIKRLIKLFAKASVYGSLLQLPQNWAVDLPSFNIGKEGYMQGLLLATASSRFLSLVRQASILARRYDVVITNPPYLSGGSMCKSLKEYVADTYPSQKGNLYACFLEMGLFLAGAQGRVSMVTPQNWMFSKTFCDMRRHLITSSAINNLIHIGYNSFPAMNSKVVQAVALSLLNARVPKMRGAFINLNDDAPQVADKEELMLAEGIARRRDMEADDFESLPGYIFGYGLSERIRNVFCHRLPLKALGAPKQGIKTGDNDRFIRFWHEVSICRCALPNRAPMVSKWWPCTKGGEFRRWYGNYGLVLNWEQNGEEIRNFIDDYGRQRSRPQNTQYFFLRGITWTSITSAPFSARLFPDGFVFESKGPVYFPSDKDGAKVYHCMLNSSPISHFLQSVSPALDYTEGAIASLPSESGVDVDAYYSEILELSKRDWDAFERSWDFTVFPLLGGDSQPALSLERSYDLWTSKNSVAISRLRTLEEENNRGFISAYDLEGEISPDVRLEDVTLTVNPDYRYGASLSSDDKHLRFRRDTQAEMLSYLVGCMMGRYCLDQPGIILADNLESQPAHLAAYEEKVGKPIGTLKFKPDLDGIIPVLDGEWFEDDIVARTREFLAVTFPESSVAENLRFIEESIGKNIRKYFCTDFYKDHLQTYKRRPVYWMVQSPKKGFACLIYLHRYTPDTLLQVLNNYFRPYLQKLEVRLGQLEQDRINDSLPTRERTAARKEADKITKVLKECQAWEQDALLPMAQQRIPLDLDDGVKVNYLKLKDVLAPIPGLAAKGD